MKLANQWRVGEAITRLLRCGLKDRANELASRRQIQVIDTDTALGFIFYEVDGIGQAVVPSSSCFSISDRRTYAR